MMKVINISGDNQSGRTRALIDFVSCQAQEFNSKCLVVCPTNERVANLNQRCRLNQSSEFFNNVKFIGSSSFNMECISSNYDVIAFDGIEQFNKNDEGCYKVLASSRLLTKKFGTLVYTSDGKNFRVKRWVSQAVWYKPWTWKDGYYTQDVEL